MKRIIVLASLMLVLFLAAPDKLMAQSDQLSECVRSGRNYQRGGIKIAGVRLRRKGVYNYPQIVAPKTPQQRKFNADVLKIVRADIAADPGEGYGFSVSYATPEFISVELFSSFCGASCHVGITAFNFDLKAGKRIDGLAELFKPGSDYLETIASYSVGELRRCQWGEEDEWFTGGTAPEAQNYSIWSLTRDGIRITFPEYQIAPGAFEGIDVVVPYSHLEGMLRQDVGWFLTATPAKQTSKRKNSPPDLSNAAVTAELEDSWNYYIRTKIFLGPTYFGNTTSFGRWGDKPYALALMSDYREYLALAAKGVIKLDSMSLAGAPDLDIQTAAAISLTEAGTKLGTLDDKANTVTFVLGTYKVERIESNSAISPDNGNYRLVTGTHLLDIAPAFADVWAYLNWPTYRERRFRVIFAYEGLEWTRSDGTKGRDAPEWRVATASNGRFSAEDVGPRTGEFDSNNVPPTLIQLRSRPR